MATFTTTPSPGRELQRTTAPPSTGATAPLTPCGTVAASGGSFVVNGTHTYSSSSHFDSPFGLPGQHGQPGTTDTSYDVVRVTVHDTPANNSVTALSLATIAPPAVVIAATGENIATASGQAFSGVVATFTDASAGVLAGDFTATITWGDGTTSTGTVAAVGSGFVVTGTHTYTSTHDWFGFHDGFGHGDRDYLLSVQITDTKTSDQASASSQATVAPTATNLTVAAQNVSATVGQSFSGVVATFTDTNGSLGTGDFTAIINWGDGTTSAGTIVANPNGGFEVTGTHTYSAVSDPVSFWGGPRFGFGFEGFDDTLPLTVAVQAKTGSDSGQSQSQATVNPPALNVTATGALFSAVFGTAFTGTVATFTAPGGVTGLTATIDWGDGSTSTGTIVADPHGGYDVTGTHTYGYPGNGGWGFGLFEHTTAGPQPFLVNVTLTNATTNATATAVSLASVTAMPPTLVASGLNLPNLSVSNSFSGTVATFTDSDGSPASSFKATIVWGDGTISAGTITANGGNGFPGRRHAHLQIRRHLSAVRGHPGHGRFAGRRSWLGVCRRQYAPVDAGAGRIGLLAECGILLRPDRQILPTALEPRRPSSGELSWWVNAMQHGSGPTRRCKAAFLSSPEYVAHASARQQGRMWTRLYPKSPGPRKCRRWRRGVLAGSVGVGHVAVGGRGWAWPTVRSTRARCCRATTRTIWAAMATAQKWATGSTPSSRA